MYAIKIWDNIEEILYGNKLQQHKQQTSTQNMKSKIAEGDLLAWTSFVIMQVSSFKKAKPFF